MKSLVRWSLKLGILGLLTVTGLMIATYVVSNSRMARFWDLNPDTPAVPTDSASVAWGEHVAESRGCTDCHGANLGGKLFLDAGPVATLYSTNLTTGVGGVGKLYDDKNWIRAIRHGIALDGRGLLFMPSHEYYFLSDRDVSTLVAYLKTLSPVDWVKPASRVGPLGRVLYLGGKFPLLPVEMIDHSAPRPEPAPGPTVEYGAYLAVACTGCHGPGLSGGDIPGTPPDWPPSSNLTPDPESGIGGWTAADFFRALREGVRPDGAELRQPYMPVSVTSKLEDYEIVAIFMYLRTLEPLKAGGL